MSLCSQRTYAARAPMTTICSKVRTNISPGSQNTAQPGGRGMRTGNPLAARLISISEGGCRSYLSVRADESGARLHRVACPTLKGSTEQSTGWRQQPEYGDNGRHGPSAQVPRRCLRRRRSNLG
eukprot:scaffold3837_cov110-Isochrysis_galbana.AAC.10